MSLFRVEIQYTIFVEAESKLDAELDAEKYVGEDGTEPDEALATEVKAVADIPKEWMGAIPFGGERGDDRTCQQRIQ